MIPSESAAAVAKLAAADQRAGESLETTVGAHEEAREALDSTARSARRFAATIDRSAVSARRLREVLGEIGSQLAATEPSTGLVSIAPVTELPTSGPQSIRLRSMLDAFRPDFGRHSTVVSATWTAVDVLRDIRSTNRRILVAARALRRERRTGGGFLEGLLGSLVAEVIAFTAKRYGGPLLKRAFGFLFRGGLKSWLARVIPLGLAIGGSLVGTALGGALSVASAVFMAGSVEPKSRMPQESARERPVNRTSASDGGRAASFDSEQARVANWHQLVEFLHSVSGQFAQTIDSFEGAPQPLPWLGRLFGVDVSVGPRGGTTHSSLAGGLDKTIRLPSSTPTVSLSEAGASTAGSAVRGPGVPINVTLDQSVDVRADEIDPSRMREIAREQARTGGRDALRELETVLKQEANTWQ